MRIFSVNVCGLIDANKQKIMIHKLKKMRHDFILLQETHLNNNQANDFLAKWKNAGFFSPGRNHSGGTLILNQGNNFDFQLIEQFEDALGRFNYIILEVKAQKFLIINVYATSGQTRDQESARKLLWECLIAKFEHLDVENYAIIMGGDFNMVLNELDRYPQLMRKKCASSEKFKKLLNRLNVEDLWRVFNPNAQEFTYKATNNISYARLDRLYISKHLRQFTDIRHEPMTFSDHLNAVEATVRLNSLDIGKNVWILNRKHLNNVLYNEQVAKLITEYNTKTVNSANKREEWDDLKRSIKNFSKTFSRSEAKSRRVAEYKLKKQLRNALKKAHLNINMRKLCVELKFKLEQFEINRARGAAVRAKIKWRTLGEKCNSFFFQLEKAKIAKQVVTRIKDKNGNEKNTTEEILKEFELFYKNLYRESKNSNVHQKRLLDRAKVNRISENQQLALTQPITLMEAKSALQGMTNNKSPGPDGLTVEFYKTHFNVLGDAIVSMLNEVVSENEMATSQKEALISCIFKKGDKCDISNWRPISLLNTDYKILTKIIANRLKPVLATIISEDQTACVPHRTIYYNLAYTRDIIQIANDCHLDASIISIDQVKAFDRVDRNFLFECLVKFGFNAHFVNIIKTIYYDISARLKINGFTSEKFQILRGVRQGCPLSMILYVMQAEIFACYIRQNNNIRGIYTNGHETKLQQYADDTIFYITGDHSITALGKALTLNRKATGAKLNIPKCQGLWLGRNRNESKPNFLNFSWDGHSLKSLGVVFTNSPHFRNTQWQECIEQLDKKIHHWKKFKLSFKGKSIVINQTMLSNLWHLAFTIPLPGKRKIKLLESKIEKFLWDNSSIKTNKMVSKLPIQKGGLNIVDIRDKLVSIQVSWLSKLFNQDLKGAWRDTATFIFDRYRDACQGERIFLTAHSHTSLKTLPPYYRQMAKHWATIYQNCAITNLTIEEILNQPIYHNPHIRRHNIMLKSTPLSKQHDIHLIADVAKVFVPGFLNCELTGLTQKHLTRIIMSIPQQWKEQINTQHQSYDHRRAKMHLRINGSPYISFGDLTPKNVYKLIAAKKHHSVPTHYHKWNQYFATSMTGTTQKEWARLFLNVHKNTSNNKADEVKYKIIHFAVPTNSIFKKRGHAPDDLCPQCMKAKETLAHMIYSCEKVQPLIKYAIAVLNKIYLPQPAFKNTFKFFFFSHAENVNIFKLGKRILNELIYIIHCNRMRSFHDRSTFTRLKLLIEFQCRLKNIIYEEREFAKQNHKLDDFLLESRSIWDADLKLKLDTNLNIYLS